MPSISDFAVVRHEQRCQRANGRRLARAVLADEPVDRTVGHVHVQAIERFELAAVAFDETRARGSWRDLAMHDQIGREIAHRPIRAATADLDAHGALGRH